MANTYLTMTQPSGGSRRKWTWSAWVKKSSTGANQSLCVAYQDSANWTSINFETSDQLNFYEYQGNSVVGQKKLSMVSRDTNGWYHFMIIWDSENTTADDRMIIYVNGVRQTAFSASTNPAVNTSTAMNRNNYPVRIGTNNSNNYFNGLMSHVNFCGGSVLAPTVFGETDATTGEWKIKADATFTPGIGGYSILKDGNTITDQSTNSNNFSLGGGTFTKTEDNPSNVFATLNSLYRDGGSAITYSNGNNTCDVGGANDWCTSPSTLGATSGKFYFEGKFTINSGTEGYIGIAQDGNLNVKTNVPNYLGIDNYSIGYYSGNGKYYRATSSFTYGNTFTTGDIVGCAVDIDNKKIYFSKNGVWQNSGDPTSGATGTGAIDVSSYFITGDPYFLCFSPNQSKFEGNFGNGYFGTTAVSSAGTNASGIGIFEYDVPTGYTALSTKGLNL